MPNRILREGILESDRIDKIGPMSEIFYRRLMSVVDDYGRYTAAVQVLLSRCFPTRPQWADAELVHTALHECEQAGLIRIYNVNKHNYLEVLDFRQQQRAKYSKYPDPSDGCIASASHLTSVCDLSPHDSSDAPSTSTSPNIRTKKEEKKEPDDGFETRFWPLSWRKVGKEVARKSWKKKATSDAMRDIIIAAAQRDAPVYLAREVELRPHMATWLNQERYNDEPELPFVPIPKKSRLDQMAEEAEAM